MLIVLLITMVVQQMGSLLHSEALQAVVLPRQWQRSGPAVRSPGERHGHQSSSPSCLKLWGTVQIKEHCPQTTEIKYSQGDSI